jgi:nitrate reductase alpha subunit
LLKGDQAVIVRHDIWRNLHEVFEVRNFSVSYPYFVALVPRIDVFVRLKKHRRWHAFSSHLSNEQFFTVERGGRVIFDSRRDVPWPTAPDTEVAS